MKDVFPAAAKKLRSLGEPVTKALGKWWRGGLLSDDVIGQARKLKTMEGTIDETIEVMRTLPIKDQKILGELYRPFKNKLETQTVSLKNAILKLDHAVGNNAERLATYNKNIIKYESKLKALDSQLDDLTAQLSRPPLPKEGQRAAEVIESIKSQINSINSQIGTTQQLYNSERDLVFRLRDSAEEIINKKEKAERLLSYVQETGRQLDTNGLGNALEYLKNLDNEFSQLGSSLQTEIPGLSTWYTGIAKESKDLLDRAAGRLLTSSNIESNRKFLKEYARMHTIEPENVQNWLNNPANRIKISEIKSGKTPKWIRNLFERLENDKDYRKSFAGTTPRDLVRDIAHKLKIPAIGAGAIGATAAAFKIVNWFSDSSPENLGMHATRAITSLNNINASGAAVQIVNSIKSSLSIIDSTADKINAEFGDNPAVVMESHLPVMTKELANVIAQLRSWNIVERNCANPDTAKKAKADLMDLIAEFDAKMNGLGSAVSGTAGAGSTPVTENNITRIQGLLKIDKTGILDRPTTDALRNLEREFNDKTGDTRFIGRLVFPEMNYVIDYDKLVNLYSRIQRY